MSYNCLAKYYQLFTDKDCDYTQWSQYLYSVLKSHYAVKGVDLACGTGKMTRLLAKMGFNVIGCDSSMEMLTEARMQGKATYVCQDMLHLSLPNKVDFVTIVNDGVNYIEQAMLDKLFATIHNSLLDGGLLIFDISSSYKLNNIIANNVFYYDMDNVTCLWSNNLSSNYVDMDIVLFETNNGTVYTRQDEQHRQYIHMHNDILQKLDTCGYDVVATNCYTNNPVDATTQRITYTAIKRG